jgi:hypothetical protein
MASTFTPTNWPNVFGPYAIDVNDCIGDSVGIINANTNYLASYTAAVSSTASTQIISSASSVTTTLSTVPYARLNQGNQTGSAPLYGVRAWVNFDTTRNSAGGSDTADTNRFIRQSGNVSTVEKTATGVFRITFTTSLVDANYAVVGFANAGTVNPARIVSQNNTYTPLNTECVVRVVRTTDGAEINDSTHVNVMFIR